MSTTTVYLVSANIPGNGDTCTRQRVAGENVDDVNNLFSWVGSKWNGTFDKVMEAFYRFELDIPEGATLLGVKFAVGIGTEDSQGPVDIYGGFLKRQENAKAWETANGCEVWDTDGDVPFASFVDILGGVYEDDTVFFGGSPGFPNTSMARAGSSSEWSFGEGTFDSETNTDVVGLLAQLQAYLDDDDNQATRGDTSPGAIAVMLTFLRETTGGRDEYQGLPMTDQIVDLYRPRLTVEYDPLPDSTRVLGEPEIRPAVQGRANLQGAVSAEVSVQGAVSGQPSLQGAVSGSGRVRDVVTGRGRIR